MKIVFFGTGEFSATILNGLVEMGQEVIGVVSQPDKINGRNNKLIFSPVKQYCIKNNIPLYQFAKLNKEGEIPLKQLDADLFVTASYGQIIRQNILDIPKICTINVHASLLPKYRGSSPIQWAIINGEKVTGVTIMRTDAGLDTGDMFLSKQIEILPDDTSSSVFSKLSTLGIECLKEFFANFNYYISHPIKQDESAASYYPMIKKEDYLLNFDQPATNLVNKIRGLENCYFTYKNSRYKILFAKPCDKRGKVGEILECSAKLGLIIACQDTSIEVVTIQPEGKTKMPAKSYMNSNKFTLGDIIK